MDILGPLPLTERGNKYVLVCSDYFTKWVEAIPLKNQEAVTIADALIENVFSRFGMPLELHSDQGRNFESVIIKIVCQKMGIHKTRTTPYRPQSDGHVKRYNKSLLDALSKVLDQEDRWDLLVPIICMYYRASVHRATGCSPALLMLGRELRLPLDIAYPPKQPSPYADTEDYLTQLEDRIFRASEFARKYLQMDWEKRQRNCSQHNRAPKMLDTSRPVFVFNPSVARGHTPKFARMWKGPYKILEKLSDLLYRVQLSSGKGKPQVVHRAHIYQPAADVESRRQ